jgi:hypothetical protein
MTALGTRPLSPKQPSPEAEVRQELLRWTVEGGRRRLHITPHSSKPIRAAAHLSVKAPVGMQVVRVSRPPFDGA